MSEKMPFGAENDPSKIEATEATKQAFLERVIAFTIDGPVTKVETDIESKNFILGNRSGRGGVAFL